MVGPSEKKKALGSRENLREVLRAQRASGKGLRAHEKLWKL